MTELNYTKGDKVLFGNEWEIKEGKVAKVYQDNGQPMLILSDSIGSTFIRPVETVFKGTLSQAKASPDTYELLVEMLEETLFGELPTEEFLLKWRDKAVIARFKAENKGR